jgi:hypothetical protein
VASSIELVVLLSLAGLAGFIGLQLMWVRHRPPPVRRRSRRTAIDPIMGARDRIEIYDSGGSFIPMPGHLTTRDEMVAWMTKELPKLTVDPPKG